MSQAGIIDIEQSHPQIPTSFITNNGTAIPIGNNLEIIATTVPNHGVPLETLGSGNTVTIEAQFADAAASSSAANAGFASFNSADFTVDANGFVSSTGSSGTETLTGNSGVATSVANNINVQTVNTTVKFVGSSNNLIQDFGLTNLLMGSPGSSISSAVSNVGIGIGTLASITSSASNVAIGSAALGSITSASNGNIGIGRQALTALNGNGGNVCVGFQAGLNITTGGQNLGLGNIALSQLTTGSNNICVNSINRANYTSSESNNILLGGSGVTGESNVIRIGSQGTGSGQQSQCFLAGVLNTTSGRTVNVTRPSSYPYAVQITDDVISIDTSTAANTLTLPSTLVQGTRLVFKDRFANASMFPFTINGNGNNIVSNIISSSYTASSNGDRK